ncbi:DUF3168 domain-containing protein [Alsobacter sp. R-9]
MNAMLALQGALRTRLIETEAVTELVEPNAIFDRHSRPERFPCVVIGEGQAIVENADFARRLVRVFFTVHVWSREVGTTHAKAITGAVASALKPEFDHVEGHKVLDLVVASARFLRDPAGEHSHAVLTVEALVQEAV